MDRAVLADQAVSQSAQACHELVAGHSGACMRLKCVYMGLLQPQQVVLVGLYSTLQCGQTRGNTQSQ